MSAVWRLDIGARVEPGGTRFRVWAPAAERVEVVLEPDGPSVPMARDGDGYFAALVEGVGAGARYRYRLDGGESYPDPASRSQPEGVHGPSRVVDTTAHVWNDAGWRGLSMDALVIYELHVGTFTPEGTFDAAIRRFDHLVELGVSAIEVMPIADFAGSRNWGYDGVSLFAPAAVYGGPEGFRRFVDAAHVRGLGVILDVVYNHLGPDGNYLPAVTGGRFFTDRHKTPWGEAVNYDGEGSAAVRGFVLQNALHWAHEYHVDGFRLDATHAIIDDSPRHLLEELADALHRLEPRRLVIAEDERNERRLLLRPESGGHGLDAVWADDLHHQLRRLTAGDAEGYFAHYAGTANDVAETLEKGWFYEGQEPPGGGEPRGTPAADLPPRAFVHCIQNHDQVGNRAHGTRLNHDVASDVYRAVSALLLTSPFTPLLWMGQEWAASTPFQYFTDHPQELGRLVTEGRREEFKLFSAFSDPATRERIPDPQAPETFARSKLRWEEVEQPPHAGVLELYRVLLRIRASEPAFRIQQRGAHAVSALSEGAVALRRSGAGDEWLLVANLAGEVRAGLQGRPVTAPPAGRPWQPVLSTEELRFGGSGEWGRLEAYGDLHLLQPCAVLLRAAADG